MFKYFIYFFDKLKKFRSIIFFLFGLLNFNYLSITDLTWTNAISISASNPNFLYLNGATNATIIIIDRINVYNTTLMRNLINWDFISYGSLSVSNSVFSNLKLTTGNSLIKSRPIKQLIFKNITLIGITELTNTDTSTVMLSIEALNLDTNLTFEISEMMISNSSSKFLQLSGILNAPSSSKILNICNVQLTNATINYQNNLIEFGNIETQVDFTIIISNILFSNINFVAGGNMLSLQHQTANTMVIQNSVFQNIYGGSVTIESANKQRLDLPTKVWFQNLTANNLNEHLNSFIKVYLGAELNITDSVFSNIFNIQSGSVMYAGDQNSMTIFKNWVFSNNTSVTGGVFNIEYNSLVILDGCSVFNNFAIQSGVIQINSNAHYQFFNSSFYHNYAISSSFGEIFDTSELSVISNCTIYQNYIITNQTLVSEIKNWVNLWFMTKEFGTYIINK